MLGQTPEILEQENRECLDLRTASLAGFRSLGPADMVQLQKVTKSKVSSTYHFVTGIDVSSAAAIAAYMTTLNQTLGENQLWYGKNLQWKITEGTYCSWNIFSKVDIRVTTSFPGGTKMYIVAPDGLTEDVGSEVNEELWHELYMSAMIRCLLLKDEDAYVMANTRHEFPFEPRGVALFLDTFEKLYLKGPLVGAAPWVQAPTLNCNYMVDALYTLLDATGAYKPAIEMLGRIEAKEVLAKVLLLGDEETNAVGLLVDTVMREPRNASMLALEAEFCLSKNRLDLALDCAKRAVWAAPSEFFSWEILSKVCIAQGEWEQAWLALNSTPLIPLIPHDTQKLSTAKKVHTPLPSDGVLDEVWEYTSDRNDPVAAQAQSVDPKLARLPAAHLRGCTQKAYSLLATIYSKVGWSEMVRMRAQLFWMEAESYGQQNNGDETKENKESESQKSEENNKKNDAPEDIGATESSTELMPQRRTLRSKRLCGLRIERLFHTLYSDIAAYSEWQRESIHLESQRLNFDKSAYEWQLFGCLAQRLKHTEQAKNSFERSQSMYFNQTALVHELDLSPLNLVNIVKLCAWYHRWYNEFSPRAMSLLRKLVARDGLTKITYEIEALFGKQKVLQLMQVYLDRLVRLKVTGYDM